MTNEAHELKMAVVTGAGSGVGRAVAVMLARAGWGVALVGRRASALEETASNVRAADGAQPLVCACDVGRLADVKAMAERVLGEFGGVGALVCAAGLNTPRRTLRELSDDDYHAIVATNMNGAYYCAQAFLPAMRAQRRGTIVNVSSISALRPGALAGVAYSMSKAGMNSLTAVINAEEREHGVRACAVCPGDINTPLLDQRPSPPPAEARARMLTPDDVAACVMLAIQLPPHVVIEEIVVRPM